MAERLRDRRTGREGILSFKHRRCNETNEYHPAQQSPRENDWLPRHENMHGGTSGDEEQRTSDPNLLLQKNQPHLNEYCAQLTIRVRGDGVGRLGLRNF